MALETYLLTPKEINAIFKRSPTYRISFLGTRYVEILESDGHIKSYKLSQMANNLIKLANQCVHHSEAVLIQSRVEGLDCLTSLRTALTSTDKQLKTSNFITRCFAWLYSDNLFRFALTSDDCMDSASLQLRCFNDIENSCETHFFDIFGYVNSETCISGLTVQTPDNPEIKRMIAIHKAYDKFAIFWDVSGRKIVAKENAMRTLNEKGSRINL